MAHNNLGAALGGNGDWHGEIAEEREALRLNPNNDAAHGSLGVALGSTGDSGGAIVELREALRLNPNNDRAHANLGVAFGNKGDWDSAIAETLYQALQPRRLSNESAIVSTDWLEHNWEMCAPRFLLKQI